jgi:hypothetical protein
MIIDLPKIVDLRGALTFIEGGRHIPFEIKRVYYLYDVANNKSRGQHAHKNLCQIMVAISGEFDVMLDNGALKSVFHLSRPDQGLLIDRMVWREMYNFSPGSVCLVLASEHYEESDYFRSYEDFIAALRHAN